MLYVATSQYSKYRLRTLEQYETAAVPVAIIYYISREA